MVITKSITERVKNKLSETIDNISCGNKPYNYFSYLPYANEVEKFSYFQSANHCTNNMAHCQACLDYLFVQEGNVDDFKKDKKKNKIPLVCY